jgi:hypothetical protein
MQEQGALQQQQAAFAQQMQPLQLQQLQAQIDASKASAAHSGAATNLLGVQTNVANLGLADKQLISSTLKDYFSDEAKTVKDLAPIIPLLDATAVENLGKAEQIRVNGEVAKKLNSGEDITANDIRQWSNRQTLLKPAEQQQFQQSFFAMSPNFQAAAKSGMINVVNAAFAGDMDSAKKSAAEVQAALKNSNDTSPAAKAVSDSFGKLVGLMDNPNLPPQILALNAVNAANLVGDAKFAEEALKVVKEHTAEMKAGAERPLPSAVLKNNEKLETTAKTFDASAKELSSAADALKQFYAGGEPESGMIHEKFVKAKNVFSQQPEIPIRNELQRVLNLGGLGAEAQAQGGAVRSNAMVNLATKYIPDVWKNPQAAIEKAQLTATVKSRMAEILRAEKEWNSQFREKENATENLEISGIQVSKGQSKSKFVNAITQKLFPPDEEVNAPALKAMIGGGTQKSTTPVPTKAEQITGTPDLTMPPAGAVRRVR